MISNLRLLILVAALLTACGGGSSPKSSQTDSSVQTSSLPTVVSPVAECLGLSSSQGVASQGVASQGIVSQGVEGTGFTHKIQGVVTDVTEFGLTVNDITFDASHAVVFVNGVCATLADVYVGTTATVNGDINDAAHTGIAYTIYADESVVGNIDAIDAATGNLSVNGQPIIATPTTVFGDDIEPAQLSALNQGNMIAVSGSMRSDGILVATRIHRWPTNAYKVVAGVVTSIDINQQLLHVGGVEVKYDGAALVDFPDDVIRPGDYIRAIGQTLGVRVGFSGATGIDASAIERVNVPAPDPKSDIVLSGAISQVRGGDDFDVMGQPVKTYTTTRFAGLLMDLVNWGPAGYLVTVFGSLDPSGYVIAKLVVPQNGAPLLIAGPITSIDRSTRTVHVIGVPVRLSDSYSYLERSDGNGQAISFDSLNVGDQLAVEGSPLDTELVDGLIARQNAPSSQVAVSGWGWNPSASRRPIIVLTHGIQADTTNAEFFWGHPLGAGCSCSPSSADRFWNYAHFRFLEVQIYGMWTGDHIEATKVYWLDD